MAKRSFWYNLLNNTSPGSNDLLARVLAVILAGIVAFYSTIQTSDRFTGEDAKAFEARIKNLELNSLPESKRIEHAQLNARISYLEDHISPDGQAAVHSAINAKIGRLEQDVLKLPPAWLKEDIAEIKRKLEALEREHLQYHNGEK